MRTRFIAVIVLVACVLIPLFLGEIMFMLSDKRSINSVVEGPEYHDIIVLTGFVLTFLILGNVYKSFFLGNNGFRSKAILELG